MQTKDNSEEVWESIVDFAELDKDGIPAQDILKTLQYISSQGQLR
jgi:hypothetical protein